METKIICISGIPGTGKTTVCRKMNDLGHPCVEGNELATRYGCISGDQVDIDCLSDHLLMDRFHGIIAAHYAHLLPCDVVIILEADESKLRERMKARGYPDEKIEENLDAQRSDVIYSESLDLIPSTRIFRINNEDLDATILNIEKIIDQHPLYS